MMTVADEIAAVAFAAQKTWVKHRKSYFQAGGKLGGGDQWYQQSCINLSLARNIPLEHIFANPASVKKNELSANMMGGVEVFDLVGDANPEFMKLVREYLPDSACHFKDESGEYTVGIQYGYERRGMDIVIHGRWKYF